MHQRAEDDRVTANNCSDTAVHVCCLQVHAAELEQRLAQVSAELSTSRALEGRLQQRLAASVPAEQLEEMAARLDAAEAAAKHEGGAMAAMLQRAEAAEAKAAELSSRKQRQLADITNLR
jgi:cell pole-organizing protein PopZ